MYDRLRSDVAELRQMLPAGGIRAVYQPIVDLQTREPVAYEALARGPAGTALESPARLFPTAELAGLLPAVDRACRAAAVERALRSTRQDQLNLFINVEAATIDGSPLFEPAQQERIERDGVRVVVELTERALTKRPADVLAAAAWLRGRGVGVALDDVGVDRRSLALMPFLRPDVVKLDMRLVQDPPSPAIAAIANAVWAEAERSGAQVLAEGIETEQHLRRAISLGARLGQGWLFGHPDELPLDARSSGTLLRAGRRPPVQAVGTPFRIVTRGGEVRRGEVRILLERSMQLEAHAAALGGEVVVLSTFQEAPFFTDATRDRYAALAADAAFVGAFGTGMSSQPAPGVRGGAVEASDPLHDEWNVIVLSPHFAGAFAARDLGAESGLDGSRQFEFSMTYDRDRVAAAAGSLIGRVVPQLGPADDVPEWLGLMSPVASRA